MMGPVWLWFFLIVIESKDFNMLETNNNIIIVDDNKEHLQYLANVFCHYGIGCRTILYDGFPDIDAPLENVKLAFFDITLTDAGDENAQMAVLRDALKTYISPKNKAFALVFWTNRPEYKDKFVKFVNRSEDKAEIPKPLCVEVIDKNEFLEHEEEIEQRLSDLMDVNIIKCLFSFDSELKQASEKSLSEILDLIEFPDDWGENESFVENIRDVFARIAIETFGDKRGKKEPDLAIKEAFGPLFIHHLCDIHSTVWKDFFRGKNITRIHNFPNAEIAAKLNTIFHLDYSEKEPDARGSVRQIDMNDSSNDELFNSIVGCNLNDWTNRVLLKNIKYQGKIKEMVAVEISAACDYSNMKKRTHQYLLGTIVPKSIQEQVGKSSLGDAFFDLPFSFMYDNEECHMFLHFNYLISEEEKTAVFKLLGKRLFSLKNEVMNMIGDRHARHISRIGINSFR